MDETIANLSDEALIPLVLQDSKYFAIIVERYQAKLLRYILKLSNAGYEEAEDTLQEVFIKVYTNLAGFKTRLSFSAWIYRIARNEVIDRFRKAKARPEGNTWDIEDNILQ